MIKFLFLNLGLLFSTISLSQRNIELDKRNGFKTIKLGALVSTFGNEVRFVTHFSETNADCYVYEPSNKDLYKVFDLTVQRILLTFDKNNFLVGILLRKTFPQIKEDSALKSCLELVNNLKIVFGNQSGIISKNSKYENKKIGAYWGSEKIILKCYNEFQEQENAVDLIVSIYDLNYLTSSIESGF